LGNVYREQGRYAQAISAYEQALEIDRKLGNRTRLVTPLGNIGRVYQAQGRNQQALDQYQQALDALDKLHTGTGHASDPFPTSSQYDNIYNRAVLLAQQQGQIDLAFHLSERARARAFYDSLGDGNLQLADSAAQALLVKEHETYTALDTLQTNLTVMNIVNMRDPVRAAEFKRHAADAEQAHTTALAAIQQRGGQLATLAPGGSSTALDRAATQALLDPQTTLVAYYVLDDRTLAFVLTRDRFDVVTLAPGYAMLRTSVEALRRFTKRDEPFPAEAAQLYKWLIAPLRVQGLLATPYLVVVPHSVLHHLPFAALGDGSHFLVDDVALTTLPSASSLPFVQANAGHQLDKPLILGNAPSGAQASQSAQDSDGEAQTVATLLKSAPILGAAATEAALRDQASQAGIIHLAMHSQLDPADPLASSIALAPGGQEDGQLQVRELYGLNLQAANLVVLSGNDAPIDNLGKATAVTAGDEVVGMTRALFFAGAPSAITTLWRTDEATSALLMDRFYTHLLAGADKAEALRRAQQDIRARYPNPYYWAGFVLSGDRGNSSGWFAWSRQLPRVAPAGLLLAGGSVLVLLFALGAVVIVRRRSAQLRDIGPQQVATPVAISHGAEERSAWQDDALLLSLLAQAEAAESTRESKDSDQPASKR
jgi:CHAT domain-containing protein